MTAEVQTMAYANSVPWHGLGNHLTSNDIDKWKEQSGMTWNAELAGVRFEAGGEEYEMSDRMVIYRNDTNVPLGIVGDKFKIVQPGEVLEFFRDITELGNFTMETAGVLFGGRRVWALAKSTLQAQLTEKDIIKPYLLLVTGMDGSLSTQASFTTICVVCNNTLQMALKEAKNDKVRITHRGTFNPDTTKEQLGLADSSFTEFMDQAETLASKKVTLKQAKDIYGEALYGAKYSTAEDPDSLDLRTLDKVLAARVNGPGAQLSSRKDTAWGVVNGMTYFLDHLKNTRSVDARLQNSWFGGGHALKEKVVDLALEL